MSAAEVAKGLTKTDAAVILRRGFAVGRMPFCATLMRPLERKGIFSRVEQKGFRAFWELTPLGLEVRRILQETADA